MPKYRVFRHEVTQPLDPSYRFIPLTQGQNAIVDTEDFERVSQWNWTAHWHADIKNFYAIRSRQGACVLMHRFISAAPADKEVDHRNHNTLDNRKHNLRPCTRSQNMQNSGVRINSKSGVKGVSPRRGKWVAQITLNRKVKCIGVFASIEEARRAYVTECKRLHEYTSAAPTGFGCA